MSQHSPNPPISGDELKRLFAEHRVVRSGKEPSTAAYAVLAERLTELRHEWFLWFLGDDPIVEAIATALETLDELLPKMRNTLLGAAEATPGDLASLDHLAGAVQAARARVWASHPPRLRRIEKSNDISEELADHFRAAMRSTNPGLELKFSNNGPIARFIAAVTPLIIVIGHPPPSHLDTVARYLQRHAKR
jgi:hypothetical protein